MKNKINNNMTETMKEQFNTKQQNPHKNSSFQKEKKDQYYLDTYETDIVVEEHFYFDQYAVNVHALFEGVTFEGTETNPNPNIKLILKQGAMLYLEEKNLIANAKALSGGSETQKTLKEPKEIKPGVDIEEFITIVNQRFNVKITSIDLIEFTRGSSSKIEREDYADL